MPPRPLNGITLSRRADAGETMNLKRMAILDRIESLVYLRVVIRLDVFLRKIDRSFQVREDLDQFCSNSVNYQAESTFQLFSGRTKCEITLGTDQVHDGLRLGQIHLAI